MPITHRQFDLGISPQVADWIAKIQSFLKEHAVEGCSEEEIRDALSYRNGKKSRAALSKALEVLVDFEALGKRSVQGKSYYMYRGEPVEPIV